MSPSQAKSLAYWLLSQTNTLDQKQGAPNGDPKIDLQGDQEGDERG